MVTYRGTFPETKRKYIKDDLFVQSQRILEEKKSGFVTNPTQTRTPHSHPVQRKQAMR